MKIVNILGGLGNQMFEYAMFLALKKAHPDEKIMCCTRSFKGYALHNGFELGCIFGIKVKEASLWQLARLAFPFWNYRTWQVMRHWFSKRKTMTSGTTQIPFDKNEVERTDSVYYDGYWQNEGNFRDIRNLVLTAFTFPEFQDEKNKMLACMLKTYNSVSCHIRRGDYLKIPTMCVCTPEYYVQAIDKMNKLVNPNLYCVFSDDINWCKNHLSQLWEGKKVVYVDWNKGKESFRDMQLMSLCKHNIIANSSFSWWGAWLNQNEKKIVIAPEKWMNKNIINDPICNDWMRVKS